MKTIGLIVILAGSSTGQILFPIVGGQSIPGPPSGPVITSTSPLPPGTVSVPYSFQFTVQGTSPITWSATGLSPGLILDSNAGILEGTPTMAGTFMIDITATNSVGTSGPVPFSLTINPPILPTITSSSPLPAGSLNTAYSFTFMATGTLPITWTSTTLPTGLVLSSLGVLSGTPTAAGTSTFNVTATNTAGSSAPMAFSLTISPPGIFTAATCNLTDVNNIVNGPIHTAVDGDTIVIPSGACTWSGGITIPSGIGITIKGTGTPNVTPATSGASASCTSTSITFNLSTSINMLFASPVFSNSLTRISCLQIISAGTGSTTSMAYLIKILGTCTALGCPQFREDNLTVPTAQICLVRDAAVSTIANVFGVADHNTIGDVPGTGCTGATFVQVNHSAWQGMTAWGDFSWVSPDTFGTNQSFYLENNIFTSAQGTDTEGPASLTQWGGGRFVCRFNSFVNVTTVGTCINHGTETGGRMRGVREQENYGNTMNCTNTSGCSALGYRSGVSINFNNTLSNSGGGFFSNVVSLTAQRAFRPVAFGLCNGTNPFDVNDGVTTVFTGTISAVGTGTITLSGASFTPGAFNFTPSTLAVPGTYYAVFDSTVGQFAGIASNTVDTLTVSWKLSNLTSIFGGSGADFSVGDTVVITSSTLYDAGTMTGTTGSINLTDSSKTWPVNRWVSLGKPYSLINVTKGFSGQIRSNTANSTTYGFAPYPGNVPWTFGDQYAITSASQCLDQPSVSGGQDFGGVDIPGFHPNTQTLDPTYIWNNTGPTLHGEVQSEVLQLIPDRDYYITNTSFDGSSGVGTGTLANRPLACTPRVGYFATDQGSWNTSGNGFGQGQLFICTAPNTWTLGYTPFTYPHPLIH